jgi:hypothetical protein
MFRRPDVSKSPLSAMKHVKARALTRRGSGGVRIGPVYGEDATVAKVVLAAATKSAGPRKW